LKEITKQTNKQTMVESKRKLDDSIIATTPIKKQRLDDSTNAINAIDKMIDKLPNDCLNMIFEFCLPVIAQQTCAKVCKRWNQIVIRSNRWKKLCYQEFPILTLYPQQMDSIVKDWFQFYSERVVVPTPECIRSDTTSISGMLQIINNTYGGDKKIFRKLSGIMTATEHASSELLFASRLNKRLRGCKKTWSQLQTLDDVSAKKRQEALFIDWVCYSNIVIAG
jgi:hypothetical protein